jgi:hypothetical protein
MVRSSVDRKSLSTSMEPDESDPQRMMVGTRE